MNLLSEGTNKFGDGTIDNDCSILMIRPLTDKESRQIDRQMFIPTLIFNLRTKYNPYYLIRCKIDPEYARRGTTT